MKLHSLRKIAVAIFAMCVLPSSALDYPAKGRIVAFHFNKSMADEKGQAKFTNKQYVPVWVEGADGKAETAVRLGPKPKENGHSDFSGHGEIELPKTNKTGVITAVMTYRTDKDRNYQIVPSVYFSTDNGILQYSAKREDSKKSDAYMADLGLNTGKWQTIVVTVTRADSTITFYANSRCVSIKDPWFARLDPTIGGIVYAGSTSYNIDVDELYYYNRTLTDDEIAALIGGKPEIAKAEIDTGSVEMHWGWALFQLAVAALCMFFLNLREKKLVVHTADTLAMLQQKNNCLEFNQEEADRLMSEAYSYWGGPDNENPTDLLPKHYPESKKDMKVSVRAYNQSLLLGNPNDEEYILMVSGFARAYNAAHVRIFNGKWWVLVAAVVAIFVKGIFDGLDLGIPGIGDSHTGMPDGFMAQLWYISKFMLPGVMISAVAYVACSFGVRWRNLKESLTILPSHLKDIETANRRKMITAGLICVGGLLSMVAGAVAGVAALALLAAVVGYVALNLFANHSTQKEVWIYNNGRRETHETMDPAGLVMAGGIVVAAIVAVYFASSIVIFLFNLAFIYKFIQNQLIKR